MTMTNEKVKTFKATATLNINDLTVECQARGHKIIFDEAKSLGGTDLGMNPVEATLAALGACQCIIAKLFAKTKGVHLKGLRMELEGDMLVPELENIAGGKGSMHIVEIRSKVHITTSEVDDIVREFVTFIENNCPVADLLKNPVQMIPEVILERSDV